MEYPQKNTFPPDVYKAAYDLVEYATNQFEENTKKVEDLIREREKNIKLANVLTDVLKAVQVKAKNWREILKKVKRKYPEDVVEALKLIGASYIGIEIAEALKYIPAPAQVLESVANQPSENVVQEEITTIPNKPTSEILQDIITENVENSDNQVEDSNEVLDNFIADTRFETKPSLWQKIKNSKLVRAIRFITKIRIRVEFPALPEGRGE